jgi:hypothetical protein
VWTARNIHIIVVRRNYTNERSFVNETRATVHYVWLYTAALMRLIGVPKNSRAPLKQMGVWKCSNIAAQNDPAPDPSPQGGGEHPETAARLCINSIANRFSDLCVWTAI